MWIWNTHWPLVIAVPICGQFLRATAQKLVLTELHTNWLAQFSSFGYCPFALLQSDNFLWLALSDTQIDSIQCLNFAQNWFNSIFDSKSFHENSIQKIIQFLIIFVIQFSILFNSKWVILIQFNRLFNLKWKITIFTQDMDFNQF